MKIGLLYPASNEHPAIGLQLLEGLRKLLSLKGLTEKITIEAEGIGFGGIEKEVYEKTEKLLLVQNVDIVIAFIDLRVLPVLEPLFFASGKLLMVLNAGANYPENWVPKPNIIHLTLQHAFLCSLAGREAGKNSHKNGLLAAGFYDCGYLHSSAMVQAFTEAGGKITYNYINKDVADERFAVPELSTFLANENNDTKNLLCVFDTKPAALFYNRLLNVNTQNLNLFVSPMMLEDQALQSLPENNAFAIQGFSPWHASISTDDNQLFAETLKTQASMFSLLGWEAGLILERFINTASEFSNGEALVKTLVKNPVNGPRGQLKLDEETHYLLAPFFHYSMVPESSKVVKTAVQNFDGEWAAFSSITSEGAGGWLNTYLCY